MMSGTDRQQNKKRSRFPWMQILYLTIALAAISVASIYATRITEGDHDPLNWIMAIGNGVIGIGNALQFISTRRRDSRRR